MNDISYYGRVTRYLPPTGVVHSCYGVITNEEWIYREKERLERMGFECEIRRNERNHIALIKNRKNINARLS